MKWYRKSNCTDLSPQPCKVCVNSACVLAIKHSSLLSIATSAIQSFDCQCCARLDGPDHLCKQHALCKPASKRGAQKHAKVCRPVFRILCPALRGKLLVWQGTGLIELRPQTAVTYSHTDLSIHQAFVCCRAIEHLPHCSMHNSK